ncbi:hypothetical protein [Flavobacterium suzhouense]|uniref:Uncharacterized protein n=1 Tax=Flavobacterium suzhouense TaxID=1529638 RepID=A0ABW5NUU4_9FLAO
MRAIKLILTLLIFVSFTFAKAQNKEKQIITAVEFTTDKIILNKKHAFNYARVENDFIIKNLDGKILISGKITPEGNNKFSTTIYFIDLEEQFYNEKIISRNDLIFALCENNVITKKFDLDIEKLKLFIKNYNQFEEAPLAADE